VSLLGGFCSGLLGVGGAVLLIPLLLAVPRIFGVGELSMHDVSGLTMIQVSVASISGWMSHRRSGFAHIPTILSIGIPMGIFSFMGATASKFITDNTMLLIFGCLVVIAFIMLVKRSRGEAKETTDFQFNRHLSVISGSCVGFVSGIVGAGGGFILIPVMIKCLKIPIRVAVGSSLGVVFIGAVMGSFGKMLTLQVECMHLIPIIAGSLPASLVGARLSKKIAPSHIRHTLLSLVILILIKTWYDIFKMFMT